MSSKDLDRRFGNIAMEKGFVTIDQLTRAITIQVREEVKSGERKLVGTILRVQGIITEEQATEIQKELMLSRPKSSNIKT